MNHVCLDCDFSRAIGCMAYCRKKGIMVTLSQGSCELFKDGLARFRKRAFLALALLPLVRMDSLGGTFDSIGRWIDKVTTMCLVIVILILVLFLLYLLSKLFGGGGQRG
jgi:hypothetical protein